MQIENPVAVRPAVTDNAPVECVDTEQVTSDLREKALQEGNNPIHLLIYLGLGTIFGIILVKSQVASWFRIQEMFRFDSLHMYGVIGTAVVTAMTGVQIIKRFRLKTVHGNPIEIEPKQPGKQYWLGGLIFGLGWALLGACPGPIFALIGGGISVMFVALAAALAGTWTYAHVRHRLPH